MLALSDPELFAHLNSCHLNATIYSMAPVLSFSAGTPPLDEVLRLWDGLLALGAHMNILFVVAQVILIRDDLLQTPNPNRLLRDMPPLNADAIISVAVHLVERLTPELYDQLLWHPRERLQTLDATVPDAV